ncbi:hypothetical protein [Saccharothrix obliqua]|uniref:hypothetical protein n=1 Tax=Saccharothrix obliqua TaxID=2861747 RepID=UPI001C5FC8EC|nr:hypothetical protein [Saccharothrix obliqua]MBW4718799.1 hypothetical protein [Saccharothrix obliqua]
MSGLAREPGDPEEVRLCRVACEGAAVVVSTRTTGNGLRLKLVSERTRRQVLLDATVLEALCLLTPEQATELVRVTTERDEADRP